ncbi:Ppx/GppA phosphatase family protein [Massilia horti]|uniref:Ppx/GppA phosphatase N-terminal domain-containing protein n=1 Tax=Massilia horti TaxID=2562153 RepID=A0A4Y9T5A0_9BURK|nr:hypothetical protein [Massilia horti]TFW35682.1 hypothetical protein E4O92_01635 [Massilia horti]
MIDVAKAATWAAVELGSDSFRLSVAGADGAGLRLLASIAEPVQLAAGLDEDGCLTPAVMRRALACLRTFRARLEAASPVAVRAVATTALRVARNADVFLPAAAQALGHPVEVITPFDEGALVYQGVASALPATRERRLVLDLGTAATRLVLGCGGDVGRAESSGAGVLRQSLSFFPDGSIGASSFAAAVASARARFADAAPLYHARHWDAAYGSSSVIRTVAGVIFDNALGDGRLGACGLAALRARLVEAGAAQRLELTGLAPGQGTHLAGAVALLAGLVEELGIDELLPMQAGLRSGVLWDLQRRSCGAAMA